MIIGLGQDICDIRRIEATIAKFGDRFTQRCFTQTERERSDRRKNRACSYAKRFAAKEACAKALGTGISQGVFWKDLGVVNLPSGQPTFRLSGTAQQRLQGLMPKGHCAKIHLTISDEYPLASAIVMIEAVPEQDR